MRSFSLQRRALAAVAITSIALVTVQTAFAAAPTVVRFEPADGEQNVSITLTKLKIIFSEAVQGSTGNVTLYKKVGNNWEQVQAIAGNASAVAGSGSTTVTITVNELALRTTEFYVAVAATAFVNNTQEAYAGHTAESTWNFKTVGGGVAARNLRDQRIQMMREEEARMAAAAASGGTSEESPAAPEESSSSEQESSEEPKHYAPPPRAVKEVTAEALRARERLERALANRATKPSSSQQHAAAMQEYSSPLQQRTCERVKRLFSGNQKMIDRINERLMKRFSFTCDL